MTTEPHGGFYTTSRDVTAISTTDWDKTWIAGSGWVQPETDIGQPPGGIGSNTPAATWWMSNQRLDVFVEGADSRLWQTCWNCTVANAWEGSWTQVPGGESLVSGPSVAAFSSALSGRNRIDVFFVHNGDGHVYQKTWESNPILNWVTADLGNPNSGASHRVLAGGKAIIESMPW